MDRKYNSLLRKCDTLEETNEKLSVAIEESRPRSTMGSLEAASSVQTLQAEFATVCTEKEHLCATLMKTESAHLDLLNTLQVLLQEKEAINADLERTKIEFYNFRKESEEAQLELYETTEFIEHTKSLHQDMVIERDALKDSIELLTNDKLHSENEVKTQGDELDELYEVIKGLEGEGIQEIASKCKELAASKDQKLQLTPENVKFDDFYSPTTDKSTFEK